jgi:hypothetical protein
MTSSNIELNPTNTGPKLMMNAIIGLGHTKTGHKTFYDDLDYWVGPTRIRPKRVYDNNNYWAPYDANNIGLHPT